MFDVGVVKSLIFLEFSLPAGLKGVGGGFLPIVLDTMVRLFLKLKKAA